MPRGSKRNHLGEIASAVGNKTNAKASTLGKPTVVHDNGVTMLPQQAVKDSDINERRVSKRTIKAKRKIDFIYEGDVNEDVNNNVQVSQTDPKKLVSKKSVAGGAIKPKLKTIVEKGEPNLVKPVKRCKKVDKASVAITTHKPISNLFDGVQISVNSDDEDLDYVDDAMDDDDSMNLDSQEEEAGTGTGTNQMGGDGGRTVINEEVCRSF